MRILNFSIFLEKAKRDKTFLGSGPTLGNKYKVHHHWADWDIKRQQETEIMSRTTVDGTNYVTSRESYRRDSCESRDPFNTGGNLEIRSSYQKSSIQWPCCEIFHYMVGGALK